MNLFQSFLLRLGQPLWQHQLQYCATTDGARLRLFKFKVAQRSPIEIQLVSALLVEDAQLLFYNRRLLISRLSAISTWEIIAFSAAIDSAFRSFSFACTSSFVDKSKVNVTGGCWFDFLRDRFKLQFASN